MAAAVDASSPARVAVTTAARPATTAAFNPPDNSILVALGWTGDNGSTENNTMAMSNNGAALTWTLIGRRREASDSGALAGWVEAWYATLPTGRTGMTVTGTLNVAYRWCLKTFVVTGGDLADPLGGSVEGSSTSTNATSAALISEVVGSLGLAVAADYNVASGTTATQPTSTDLTYEIGHIGTGTAGWAGYRSLGAAGSSATMNMSTTGSNPAWNYLWFEVRGQAVGATTYVKTGGAPGRAAGSGAKVWQISVYVKTGGAPARGAGSGAKIRVPGSITTSTKTGGGVTAAGGRGAKQRLGIAAVGTLAGVEATGGTTFTVTTTAVGNAIVVGTRINSSTATVTGMSGGGCTWSMFARTVSTARGRYYEVWVGTVTAVVTASPVTVSWSSDPSSKITSYNPQEFTYGAPASWSLTHSGGWETAATSASIPWPTLNVQAGGQLYFGKGSVSSGTPTATGTPAGFTFAASTDCWCYGLTPAPGTIAVSQTNSSTSQSGGTAAMILATATVVLPTPASLLDIGSGVAQQHWELQYGANAAQSTSTATLAQIASGFSQNPYFMTVPAGDGVQFWVRMDAPTTQGSQFPRSELRQNNQDGTKSALDALHGRYVFQGTLAITHLPTINPAAIVCQLHNGVTGDRISIRTQLVGGLTKLLCRVNGTQVDPRFSEDYTIGTVFTWKVIITDAMVDVYYNDMSTPIIRGAGPVQDSGAGASFYFKGGCYAQSNIVDFGEDPNDWASVTYYALTVALPGTNDKTGGGLGRSAGSGAKVYAPRSISVKTGGGGIVAAGSGAKLFSTKLKTGGGAVGRVGSGAKLYIGRVKTGGAANERLGSGPKVLTRFKTGGGASGRLGSGAKSRTLRGRTGAGVVRAAGSGPDRLIHYTQVAGNPGTPGSELLVAPYVPPSHRGLRFIARNIIDGQVVDWDLPLITPEITWTLSGPTIIKATVEPENWDVVEERVDAWATWIDVEEAGVIRASGIVQPTSIDDEKMSVEAIGVVGYPQGMPFLSELSETELDALDAVRRIWQHLLSYPDATPLNVELSQNSCGLLLGTPAYPQTDATGGFVVDAAGDPTMVEAKPYELTWWGDIDCGREIDTLAKTVPFDFIENPMWSADRDYVIHRIELGFPRIGRKRDDLRFVLDENLVALFVLREEPGTYASQVMVRGKGEGRDGIRGYAGTRSPRRLRRVVVVTDKVIPDQKRADARATDEMVRRQSTLTVGEIVIHDWHPNAPLGSYVVGDDITIQAPVSYLGDVALVHRITAYTWDPDAAVVTLQLARSDDFYYGREPSALPPYWPVQEEEPVADVPLTVKGDNSFARTIMCEGGASSMVIAQMWLTFGVIDGTAHFVLQAYGTNGQTIGSAYSGDPFQAHGFRDANLANKERSYMTLPSGVVMVKVTGSVSAGANPAMAMVISPKK